MIEFDERYEPEACIFQFVLRILLMPLRAFCPEYYKDNHCPDREPEKNGSFFKNRRD